MYGNTALVVTIRSPAPGPHARGDLRVVQSCVCIEALPGSYRAPYFVMDDFAPSATREIAGQWMVRQSLQDPYCTEIVMPSEAIRVGVAAYLLRPVFGRGIDDLCQRAAKIADGVVFSESHYVVPDERPEIELSLELMYRDLDSGGPTVIERTLGLGGPHGRATGGWSI